MYTTTGKTKALTKRTFVGEVMFLLLILSAFVTAFLPRSKSLLILWLQSPSIVILEPKKIKSVTTSTFPPSICYEVMGPDATILVFLKCWISSQHFHFSFSLIKRLFSSHSKNICIDFHSIVTYCMHTVLTTLKPFTVWITTNCGKFLKRWDYQTTWPAFWVGRSGRNN